MSDRGCSGSPAETSATDDDAVPSAVAVVASDAASEAEVVEEADEAVMSSGMGPEAEEAVGSGGGVAAGAPGCAAGVNSHSRRTLDSLSLTCIGGRCSREGGGRGAGGRAGLDATTSTCPSVHGMLRGAWHKTW